MAESITMAVPGTLGNDAGSASDGVLIGSLTATDPTSVLMKSVENAPLCFTDDGGLYVDKSTEIAESTADDVQLLPATPAVDDAVYFGHATIKFATMSINQTTQGAGTWTIVWEYWDGSAWQALSGVTDGTTGFTAATGWVDVTFTEPGDWVKNTVDSIDAYWIRARVSAYTSITTAPLAGQATVTTTDDVFTDDTTDFTDADAGDVELLPSKPAVGDGLYIGYSEQFCKVKITTSQARTGTATITLKYWDGSAWSAVTTVDDDSSGYSATAGTHLIHFQPPSDWTANTAENGPGGNTGYFVVMELTALTDVTQQPLATQGWIYPMSAGATGISCPVTGSSIKVGMDAQTASGSTADSVFLLINTSTGAFLPVTWTKATGHDNETGSLAVTGGHFLALVQVTEDGTTELADASFAVQVS